MTTVLFTYPQPYATKMRAMALGPSKGVCVQTSHQLRPDYAWLRTARREARSLQRLVAHYELETSLSRELASAERHERLSLYGTVYDRLFAELPDHPQWSITPEMRANQAATQLRMLLPMLGPSSVFVEIGCGDAILTRAVAPHVRSAIGVDVTDRLVDDKAGRPFELLISDGISIPLEDGSVDLVFSNQLIEHLHPKDVEAQLSEIYRVLKPGGRYVCATPNRLTGPHDISVFFGYTASGLHLREYDHRLLARTLRAAGFRHLEAVGLVKGYPYRLPVWSVGAVEAVLDSMPRPVWHRLMRISVIYRLSMVTVVGRK